MDKKLRICKNCGVELDDDMPSCPLCNESPYPSSEDPGRDSTLYPPMLTPQIRQKQKNFIWELISISLVSGCTATVVIDLIMNGRITWSEYPAAACLAIFSYISFFTFLEQKTWIRIAGGFVLSSFFIVLIDTMAGSINWSLKLGIPLLLATNLVVLVLLIVFRLSKQKGINLIAYAFIGAAILCLCINGILSVYETGDLNLKWSMIVAGSVFPVVLILFFMYYRLKKGRDLKKTFHL